MGGAEIAWLKPFLGELSLVVRKPVFGVSDQVDTNLAAQPQKMAGGLKFRIQKVEGYYYPCSENKGADQLRGYHEADVRLCFRIYQNPVFHDAAQSGQTVLCPLARHIYSPKSTGNTQEAVAPSQHD